LRGGMGWDGGDERWAITEQCGWREGVNV